jgi:hypothetical protein
MRATLFLLALATVLVAGAPSLAQNVPQAAGQSRAFSYRLGETTLDAARAYWAQNGMKIVGSGHMALGTGSGVDRLGKVSADRVLLVDVSGVDFEGLSTARFGFFDDRLYRIQASLASIPLNGAKSTNYSEDQLKALGAKLKAKYGKPSAEQRTLLADKKSGPDVLIWKLPDGTLTLNANALYGSLILANEKVEADIKAYVKAYCKTVNTPGHITCW